MTIQVTWPRTLSSCDFKLVFYRVRCDSVVCVIKFSVISFLKPQSWHPTVLLLLLLLRYSYTSWPGPPTLGFKRKWSKINHQSWFFFFFFFFLFKDFYCFKKKRKKKPTCTQGPGGRALPQDLYKQRNILLNMHIKVQYRLTCDGWNHKQWINVEVFQLQNQFETFILIKLV